MNIRMRAHWVGLRHIFAIYGLLPLLGFSIPLALGAYHRRVAGAESYHQFYTFPKRGARPVALQYGGDGWLHRLMSPYSLGGTLGLTNTGRPVRIRLEMSGVPEGLDIHWEDGHTKGFDLETRTLARYLDQGEAISVHHTFYVAEPLRRKAVIFNGGLKILDAESGSQLLFIPIRITNPGGAAPAKSEEACHEF